MTLLAEAHESAVTQAAAREVIRGYEGVSTANIERYRGLLAELNIADHERVRVSP